MKNIKEKSFELFPEMQTDSSDWDVIEEQCDMDAIYDNPKLLKG